METYAHYVSIFIIKHSIINIKIRHTTQRKHSLIILIDQTGQIFKRRAKIQQKTHQRFEKCTIFDTQQNIYYSINKC